MKIELIKAPQTAHFCGHDIYFTLKNSKGIHNFEPINSNCGLNTIGCSNLEYLLDYGFKIHGNDTIDDHIHNNYFKIPKIEYQLDSILSNNDSLEISVNFLEIPFCKITIREGKKIVAWAETDFNGDATLKIDRKNRQKFPLIVHLRDTERQPIDLKLYSKNHDYNLTLTTDFDQLSIYEKYCKNYNRRLEKQKAKK